jgi:hypothetical protein
VNANERLTEVFDRGLRFGVGVLSPTDHDLFRVQDFIIEYEMGGLTGYLYNRLPDLQGIRATTTAMRRFRLTQLAEVLDETIELFAGYVDPEPSCTWGELLRLYDPGGNLDRLHQQVSALNDYGLAESSIT